MRVRAHNRHHAFSRQNTDQRINMVGIIAQGAGINHGHIALTDNIGLRARIAEWRWIMRQHPPNQRAHLLCNGIRRAADVWHIHAAHVAQARRIFNASAYTQLEYRQIILQWGAGEAQERDDTLCLPRQHQPLGIGWCGAYSVGRMTEAVTLMCAAMRERNLNNRLNWPRQRPVQPLVRPIHQLHTFPS